MSNTVIITTKFTRLADSLRAVLRSVADVEFILNAPTIADLQTTAKAHPQAWVVLDATVAGDRLAGVLGWLRLHTPHCKVIALTQHNAHEQIASGAYATLRHGFSTHELINIIQSNNIGDI